MMITKKLWAINNLLMRLGVCENRGAVTNKDVMSQKECDMIGFGLMATRRPHPPDIKGASYQS
jgi:hypothetical protein